MKVGSGFKGNSDMEGELKGFVIPSLALLGPGCWQKG